MCQVGEYVCSMGFWGLGVVVTPLYKYESRTIMRYFQGNYEVKCIFDELYIYIST